MPAVPAAIRTAAVVSRACAAVALNASDDRHGFGLQCRAARVDQPPARRKQRPGRAQQLQLLGRKRCDIFRPPQQLDVRMPPDDARRRARHVEQNPLEGSPVPPAGGLARVAGHQRRRQSQSAQVVGDSRQALGRNIDRHELGKFRLQLQQVAGLAARRCTGIQNAVAGPRRDQSRAELRGGVLDRHLAIGESRQIRDVDGVLQQQRFVFVHAVRDCDVARREARPILRASRAPSIDADPERRTLIVGSENRLGLLTPVRRERIDEPARMRGAHGDIAIDLRAELRVLALTAAQERIDETGARVRARGDAPPRPFRLRPRAQESPCTSSWHSPTIASARTSGSSF